MCVYIRTEVRTYVRTYIGMQACRRICIVCMCSAHPVQGHRSISLSPGKTVLIVGGSVWRLSQSLRF